MLLIAFSKRIALLSPGQRGHGGPDSGSLSNESVISQLTEGQLSSILAKVVELKESGASFDEIKHTVDSFLRETGIELPNKEGEIFIDTIT